MQLYGGTMVVSSNIPIQIKGGNPLQGRVRIQGSKNASLPILAATLLIAGQCTLDNCPQITDVVYMQKLLEHTGCKVKRTNHRMTVNAEQVREHRLPGEYVGRMRSSVILMGALLGRAGQVGIDYPGGRAVTAASSAFCVAPTLYMGNVILAPRNPLVLA